LSGSQRTERIVSLTEQQVTAGTTYVVRIPKAELSFKRGNDAVALVKGIDGQRDDYVYDPQNPKAYRTGYVANEDPAKAVSKYDGATQAWTVTIPAGGGKALSDLRTLVSAYDAEVEDAGTATVPPVAAPAARNAARPWADWAEYGCGFGPDELDSMSEGTRRAITGS
jgi:hypothetical protein